MSLGVFCEYGQDDRNMSVTFTMQQNEYWIIFLVVKLINQFIENDILYIENESLLIIQYTGVTNNCVESI